MILNKCCIDLLLIYYYYIKEKLIDDSEEIYTAKEKPDTAYQAKREKAAELAVDLAKKYAVEHISTRTSRFKRSLVQGLIINFEL